MLRITAQQVVALLHEAEIEFVLIGAHGVSGWRDQPQASEDVDILLRPRDLERADQVVRCRFRTLIPKQQGGMIQYADPRTGRIIIDFKTPTTALGKALWKHSVGVRGVYRVPEVEAAIVSLFLSFRDQRRELSKRCWHAGDFWNVVERQQDTIDFRKLWELSRVVCDKRSAEMRTFVKDIIAGRKIINY